MLVVDEKTASASEILSGALKDNGRAKLAGHTTFGKAKARTRRGHSCARVKGVFLTNEIFYSSLAVCRIIYIFFFSDMPVRRAPNRGLPPPLSTLFFSIFPLG